MKIFVSDRLDEKLDLNHWGALPDSDYWDDYLTQIM